MSCGSISQRATRNQNASRVDWLKPRSRLRAGERGTGTIQMGFGKRRRRSHCRRARIHPPCTAASHEAPNLSAWTSRRTDGFPKGSVGNTHWAGADASGSVVKPEAGVRVPSGSLHGNTTSSNVSPCCAMCAHRLMGRERPRNRATLEASIVPVYVFAVLKA